MRLSKQNADRIKDAGKEIFGGEVRVFLFGSRVNDTLKGGDVDLLIKSPSSVVAPAFMAARMSARVSRILHGRKVDVVVTAPNLSLQPIHRIAKETGALL